MYAHCRRFSCSTRKSLLDAIIQCKWLSQIKRVHATIVVSGFGQCSVVQAKFVRKLTELNVPMEDYGQLVFNRVSHPSPFLWNALIRGYALEGRVSQSARLYCRMRRFGSRPLSFTFSALFKACGSVGDVNLGRGFHGQMILDGGFVSDLHASNGLISMYASCGYLDYARKVFDEMPERDAVSWTELIVAYGNVVGDMETAEALFDELQVKDSVAWTAMINAYSQNSRPREALDVFERMRDDGAEFDDVTLVGVISACALLGASNYAKWIQVVAETSGFGSRENVFVGSAMVHMYSKCGDLEDAFKVFASMKERNVFSYSSMIAGFAMHGHARAAIQLFHYMLEMKIAPNHVTFIGLLAVCSHTGLVEQGKKFFESMEKCYSVVPTIEHYTCLVDLLGRSGRLEEALGVIETMPIKPNCSTWGALLAACRTHRNPDIAKLAADHLFDLEPEAVGNYMLLSIIYASAEMWDQVSRTRKLVREKGIKKDAGCSWVETKTGEINEFVSGDLTHPLSDDINIALDALMNRLEAQGYRPNLSCVSYNINDEEKKRLLRTHSEKIALAYKLITTRDGCRVKIMKNLRICEDCHAVMCGASRLTGREIVVRDNARFHHFRDGTCSCGYYW